VAQGTAQVTASIWKRTTPLPQQVHRCADIHFARPIDDSPIGCDCGWSGTLADWPKHGPRLAVMRLNGQEGYDGPNLKRRHQRSAA
jgi:hypothetical protein